MYMAAVYNVPTAELEERSLYMRLFRSWLDGESYYHAALVGPCIDRLIEVGHAEAAGHGYVITHAGKKAWAAMCTLLVTRASQRAMNEANTQALKQFLVDEGASYVGNLMNELRRLLMLVDSNVPTVVRDFDKTVLMSAVRQGYAERLEPKTYRITEAGRAWLKENGATVSLATAPAAEFNPNALIHRLLAGQTIMRAELTSKEEQEFFRRLVRDVHVTVSGDGYVITKAGRAALENFGEPAPVASKPESDPEPPVGTAFSEPDVEAEAAPDPAVADDKPAKRPYTRRQTRPVSDAQPIQTSTGSFLVPVTSRPDPEPVAHTCDGKDCLPCRVLAAVMDKVPEVKDLFEAMRAQDVILDSLGKR